MTKKQKNDQTVKKTKKTVGLAHLKNQCIRTASKHFPMFNFNKSLLFGFTRDRKRTVRNFILKGMYECKTKSSEQEQKQKGRPVR